MLNIIILLLNDILFLIPRHIFLILLLCILCSNFILCSFFRKV